MSTLYTVYSEETDPEAESLDEIQTKKSWKYSSLLFKATSTALPVGEFTNRFLTKDSSLLHYAIPEVEFLEEIQIEVLRVFLLAIHRHLY
jgi:hypothetical protein